MCARAGGLSQLWESMGRRPAAAFLTCVYAWHCGAWFPAAAESIGLPCAKSSSAVPQGSISTAIASWQSLDVKSNVEEV